MKDTEQNLNIVETEEIKKNVTFLIKSFLRKDCVDNLIKSIRYFYPNTKIIVVDDSNPCLNFDNYCNVATYNLNFNVGVSFGRNFGVSKIETKYFVLLDDDFEFTKDTNIQSMYNVIEKNKLDVVAGQVMENNKVAQYSGNFVVNKKEKTVITEFGSEDRGDYRKCQLVINFFIARTETIKKYGWNNDMKTLEHPTFFYEHRDVFDVGFMENVFIEHKRVQSPEYTPYRVGQWGLFIDWMKSNDIKYYVNYSNKLTDSGIEFISESKINPQLAVKNLSDLTKIFKSFGTNSWLQDGTLLGYYRDRNIIPYDTDTNIGVMYEKFSVKILYAAKRANFKYYFSGYPENSFQIIFERFGIRTCTSFYYRKKDIVYHSLFIKKKRYDYFYEKFNLKEIYFMGSAFFVPHDELKFIRTKYGENWQIPDKNWSYVRSPRNYRKKNIMLDLDEQTVKVNQWLGAPN